MSNELHVTLAMCPPIVGIMSHSSRTFLRSNGNGDQLGGNSMGPGWYHCSECREKFTVRVGTVMERSHIALHKWLFATHLIVASKNSMSALQLSRMLGVTYKSAWFMCHRLREAMTPSPPGPMGGSGKIVESDETVF